MEKYTLSRKVYVIDTGIFNVLKGFEIGKLMENLVFLELYKRYKDVYYYSNGTGEVDFVTKDLAIQVTYDAGGIDEREFRGLRKFSDKFKNHKLIIITWDTEGKEKIDGKEVELIPLWKFLITQQYQDKESSV
ncbi:hypothetical protein SJAV_21740 [Sulfurisphaera javensis]|uniref:DUF4143 domain-containing protein n=1 Tax=Sulfurisphaera javensis TaxID=2049879 RepID=A0AAT9GUB8_9CREN